jgi:DNA-binding NtrC family response regulator
MVPVKVLLVDDETAFLKVTANRLGVRGFRVITAESGAEALRVLDEVDDLDVMVLDLRMPGLDGLAVLRQVKEVQPLLEVILLTGHATVDTGIEGIKLGAFDYLLKPCEVEVLVEKISQAGARKRKNEDLLVEARSTWSTARRDMEPHLPPEVRKALALKKK